MLLRLIWGTVVFWNYCTKVSLIKNVQCLTISWHANREAFLETAVLAPVAVHAHDQTVLILHTHLVVDVLLDAAAEKTLNKKQINKEHETGAPKASHCSVHKMWSGSLPCNPHMRALHSGNQMQCPHTLCKVEPFHLSLKKDTETVR